MHSRTLRADGPGYRLTLRALASILIILLEVRVNVTDVTCDARAMISFADVHTRAPPVGRIGGTLHGRQELGSAAGVRRLLGPSPGGCAASDASVTVG